MINYQKLEKIAMELEAKLGIQAEEDLQQEIEERTEEEKETVDVPVPSVEACDECNDEKPVVEENKTASEKEPGIEDEIGDETDGGDPSVSKLVKSDVDVSTDKEVFPTNSKYVAKLNHFIKLAKAVKKSKKMTAEEKKESLKKIEEANKKAKNSLNIKKNDLNKLVNSDVVKIMKSSNKFNDISQNKGGITLNQAIKEMKKWGKDNNIEVEFPTEILNKTIGSCNASWLIKLGPMIATMLQKYNSLKTEAEKKIKEEDK